MRAAGGWFYYVDKTGFIEDVLDESAQVLLIPRPRRFGKTLNPSMLRCFFDNRDDDVAPLFAGLAIESSARAKAHFQRHPVIFATFTEPEVRALVDACGRPGTLEGIRDFYNGYLFGGHAMYHPWSVLYLNRGDDVFRPYWIETSSNDLVRELLLTGPLGVKAERSRGASTRTSCSATSRRTPMRSGASSCSRATSSAWSCARPLRARADGPTTASARHRAMARYTASRSARRGGTDGAPSRAGTRQLRGKELGAQEGGPSSALPVRQNMCI